MAGHRQLFTGREDAHTHVAAALGGIDEGGFGEVHLLGDDLHLLRREVARLGEDSQLVTFEEAVGEDVEVEIAEHSESMT